MSAPKKPEKPSPGAALYFARLMAEAEAERIAELDDEELKSGDIPSAEALLAAVKAKAAAQGAATKEPGASKVVAIGGRPRRRGLWWVLAAAAIVVAVMVAIMSQPNKGAHAPPPEAPGQGP